MPLLAKESGKTTLLGWMCILRAHLSRGTSRFDGHLFNNGANGRGGSVEPRGPFKGEAVKRVMPPLLLMSTEREPVVSMGGGGALRGTQRGRGCLH